MDKTDKVDNRRLRQAWLATADAVDILAENGGKLHTDFETTVKIIEALASARGFDLEKGTHDPSKATDPTRAELHLDQEDNPMRVVRRDKQRQR